MADRGTPHADHDLELLAALLDGDPGTQALATERTDACGECATIAADLRSLATATARMPVPARPRDFRLTPADAARIAAIAAPAEPVAAGRRQGFDMTTPAPDHASHDGTLIAAQIDGTLEPRDASRVHDWLAACSACATLRTDLIALATATRELPTPARPREFTLTQADADRVGVRGWRRALAMIGTSRDSLTRPLAMGLTTLGIAGLVIANLPAGAMGGATSAAPDAQIEQNEAAGLESMAGAAGPAESGPPDIMGEYVPEATNAGEDTMGTDGGQSGRDSSKQPSLGSSVATSTADGPSWLVIVSLGLLLTGLALALIRWGARRLGDG